jgi:hypothetical protein
MCALGATCLAHVCVGVCRFQHVTLNVSKEFLDRAEDNYAVHHKWNLIEQKVPITRQGWPAVVEHFESKSGIADMNATPELVLMWAVQSGRYAFAPHWVCGTYGAPVNRNRCHAW